MLRIRGLPADSRNEREYCDRAQSKKRTLYRKPAGKPTPWLGWDEPSPADLGPYRIGHWHSFPCPMPHSPCPLSSHSVAGVG
ncbi:hypothetical protein [Tolypothrix sp. VBCCA 56010]|uniref:hypothetical protein n=1 Tax=Tolypothrix sp. VBCCA 56010 TaxID=3137731 RepID=UPI003D7CF36C